MQEQRKTVCSPEDKCRHDPSGEVAGKTDCQLKLIAARGLCCSAGTVGLHRHRLGAARDVWVIIMQCLARLLGVGGGGGGEGGGMRCWVVRLFVHD